MTDLIAMIGFWTGYLLVGLLCITGLVLSVLSISGTWFVLTAGVIAAILSGWSSPGIPTLTVLLGGALLVEVIEFFAGAYGIRRRGGSTAASVAALLGGITGGVLGSFSPFLLIGSLLGIFAGSFLAAYGVEYGRLKHGTTAGRIALGAVMARLWILLMKVFVTFGMTVYLLWTVC